MANIWVGDGSPGSPGPPGKFNLGWQALYTSSKHKSNILKKLLVFPGDWHILKSFQPVLMKLYYHARLKELAQKFGFTELLVH